MVAMGMSAMAVAQDKVTIRVLSFNIWYGGDQVSFDKVVEAIRLADADIVGLQEPDGRTLDLAAAAGYPFADTRRHILSRYPLFDPALGVTTATDAPPYSIAGLDRDAVHVWAMVAPGQVVAVANTHLTSDPYGPEMVRDGATLEEVLANEADVRLPEAQALVDGLGPVAARGVPVLLTGDFNSVSHLDWTPGVQAVRPEMKYLVDWPVSKLMEGAGFADTFRTAHPDPVAVPGLTWTPGRPWPVMPEAETVDRIDFVWAANATVVESVLLGETGNPAVGLSMTPFPSDHRGVLTTVEVVPVEAPALVTVEPRPVVAGGSFLIRAHVPDRGNWTAVVVQAGADWTEGAVTGIAGVSLADRPTLRLSTIGMAIGTYDVVLLQDGGADGLGEVARHRFSVIPSDGRAVVEVTAPVAPGGDIPVRFSGAPGFKLDWLGVYRVGEPSVYNYIGFAYSGARHEGETVFPAGELYEELGPGEYEMRLMLDDGYQVQAVARFTVSAP
jgi:endonuclease/exonuclease/phosphatase family metal-dependent hydrolase